MLEEYSKRSSELWTSVLHGVLHGEGQPAKPAVDCGRLKIVENDAYNKKAAGIIASILLLSSYVEVDDYGARRDLWLVESEQSCFFSPQTSRRKVAAVSRFSVRDRLPFGKISRSSWAISRIALLYVFG
jgi:hypothetical protein